MKKLMVILLMATAVWAESLEDVVRNYRTTWGYPVYAEVFQRFVTVNGGPDWWTYLAANTDSNGYNLLNFARGLADLANGLGWGDAYTLDSEAGGKGDFPPVLAMLDSWKGKMSVTINLPNNLDDAKKRQFMDNFSLVQGVVGWKHDCMPRGKKFFLTLSGDSNLTAATGKVSGDGTTYELKLPTHVGITTGQVQAFFQKGK